MRRDDGDDKAIDSKRRKSALKNVKMVDKTKTSTFKYYFFLAVLVFQTTFLVLMLRYSRKTSSSSGVRYITSTTVACSELVKAFVSAGILTSQLGSVPKFFSNLKHEWTKNPQYAMKLSVPALLYTIQNNLLFIALSNLDVVTYQVTYQLKILSTAVCSVLMLKRKYSLVQWLSLVLLMIGVILVQLPADTDVANSSKLVKPTGNSFLGLVCVLSSCVLSAFNGVYLEKIIKKEQSSLWLANFYLSVTSLVIGLTMSLIQDWQLIQEGGFFQGYNQLTWIIVMTHSLGGFVVAFVMKYADNIMKGFATSVSIVLSTLISYYILEDFIPTKLFFIGAPLVILSSLTYSM